MNDFSKLSNEELTALYQRSQSNQGTVTVRPTEAADFTKMSDDELIAAYQKQKAQQPQQSQPQQPMGVGEDVLRTAPASIARGIAGVVGLPGTVQHNIVEPLFNKAISALGFEPKQMPESPLMPSGETVTKGVESVVGPLHQPQTRVGRYVNTVGEFAPAALGPGGLLANLLKYAVVPGVVSEGAGELAQKIVPSLEGPARAIGAIVPATAAAVISRPSTAQVVNQYTRGASPQQVQEAEQLFALAQQRGQPITRAEALQYVTNGATGMGDLQRKIEGLGELKPFFAQRPQQNEQAFANVVRDVQPQPTIQPSTIGSEAANTSGEILSGVRRAINTATEPLYDAVRPFHLSPADMQRVRAIPGFDEALAAVRGNTQLNRNVANLPDNNSLVLNEVKKYMDQAAENAASPMNAQNRNQQISAGHSQDAGAVRQAVIDATGGQTGPYAQALEVQAQARRQFLEPLLQGPLGRLAKDDLPTYKAIEALFPKNPLPNSADEISTAVTALAHRRPHVARDLVRAHLESVFNETTRNLIPGPNQWGAAKFASNIRGNPQQAANLEASIRALPNGDSIWRGVDEFLRVVEAQGTRQRIGSQTAFNTFDELKGGSIPGTIAKGTAAFTQIPKKISDTWERWRLGSNAADLARLLTDPRAAREFQRLASVPAGSAQAVLIATRLTNMGLLAPR